MPTYNRCRGLKTDASYDFDLVEEAIHSYVIQDYPRKQLLILNDAPGQVLSLPDDYCHEHNIQIYNFSERFPTLGDKCNFGIERAAGDYITRWDDDDISFPWRLSACQQSIQQQGHPEMLVVEGYWMTHGHNEWHPKEGRYGFQQDLYLTELAKEVEYRSQSSYEDQHFRHDCQKACNHNHRFYHPSVAKFHYLYRWSGTGSFHASNSDKDTEKVYRAIGEMEILPLEYELQPQWFYDFLTRMRTELDAFSKANDQ